MSFFKPKHPKPTFTDNPNSQRKPFIGIQAKLQVGKTNDKYEQEADRVADKVVNKSKGDAIQKKEGEEELQQKPIANEVTPLVQKMESKDEESVQKKEEGPIQKMEDEEPIQKMEEEESVQKKQNSPTNNQPSIESRLNSSKGKGQKLSGNVKNEMESGFGNDFSNVSIHTDQNAAQMSQEMGAKAFAHGNDVYFNKGEFNPETSEGKHLLAHELTHTIQQKGMVQKKVQRHMQNDYPWPGIIANTWSASLRAKPGEGSFIMNVPRSSTVTVQSHVGNWLKVNYFVNGNTHIGYISQELVDFD